MYRENVVCLSAIHTIGRQIGTEFAFRGLRTLRDGVDLEVVQVEYRPVGEGEGLRDGIHVDGAVDDL